MSAGGSMTFSARFVRAAEAETGRLNSRLERAKATARSRKGELAAAEAAVADLERHVAQIGVLQAGSAAATLPGERGYSPGQLRGCAIREVAVALLVKVESDRSPIHYRRWHDLLVASGYSVVGQRPEAVFLNQVVRHPLVRSTSRRGFYELDLAEVERLEARVARLRTSLSVAASQEADEPPGSPGRGSSDIALELRRAERVLAEARAPLPLGAGNSSR